MREPTLTLQLVSPDQIAFSGLAASVLIPAEMGPMRVLPGHVPVLARLLAGPVRIFMPDGGVQSFTIDHGLARVTQEEVCVLANAILDAPEAAPVTQPLASAVRVKAEASTSDGA